MKGRKRHSNRVPKFPILFSRRAKVGACADCDCMRFKNTPMVGPDLPLERTEVHSYKLPVSSSKRSATAPYESRQQNYALPLLTRSRTPSSEFDSSSTGVVEVPPVNFEMFPASDRHSPLSAHLVGQSCNCGIFHGNSEHTRAVSVEGPFHLPIFTPTSVLSSLEHFSQQGNGAGQAFGISYLATCSSSSSRTANEARRFGFFLLEIASSYIKLELCSSVSRTELTPSFWLLNPLWHLACPLRGRQKRRTEGCRAGTMGNSILPWDCAPLCSFAFFLSSQTILGVSPCPCPASTILSRRFDRSVIAGVQLQWVRLHPTCGISRTPSLDAGFSLQVLSRLS